MVNTIVENRTRLMLLGLCKWFQNCGNTQIEIIRFLAMPWGSQEFKVNVFEIVLLNSRRDGVKKMFRLWELIDFLNQTSALYWFFHKKVINLSIK